jgi:hypothetical protein
MQRYRISEHHECAADGVHACMVAFLISAEGEEGRGLAEVVPGALGRVGRLSVRCEPTSQPTISGVLHDFRVFRRSPRLL